jgi:hypothetical protein
MRKVVGVAVLFVLVIATPSWGGEFERKYVKKHPRPDECEFVVGLSTHERGCLENYLTQSRRWDHRFALAKKAEALRLEELAYEQVATPPSPPRSYGSGTVQSIILQVFGPHGYEALAVAACESGFSVTAINGQYWGLFQMGESERATYGGSSTDPWDQTRAAHEYFVASGSDWSPWACKP